MSWNKVIDRAKQEVSFRLGRDSHIAGNKAIVLNLVILLNDDCTPMLWSVESRNIEPKSEALDLLKAFIA